MRKFYSLFFASILAAGAAFADPVKVEVVMNTTAAAMKFKASDGTYVETGAPVSRKYSFEVEPGVYTVENLKSDGTVAYGSCEVIVTSEEAQSFNLYLVTISATNSGWTYGTDYTTEISVASKSGVSRPVISTVISNKVYFPVLSGDTFFATFTPSSARAAEGYMDAVLSATITGNKTLTTVIPMQRELILETPAGADCFVGFKYSHFRRFEKINETSMKTVGDVDYHYYTLGGGVQYNYRISKAGMVTYTGIFKKADDSETISVTAEMMTGDPKQVDRDLLSNNKYNAADVMYNGNYTGCVKLEKDEEFQIFCTRNWQAINTVIENYFIEPDFWFKAIDEDGNPSSVVSVDAQGKVKALDKGTAIVLIGYDAFNNVSAIGGPFYGAIWPENTGVLIFSVDADESGITSNMNINASLNTDATQKLSTGSLDAELDVIYYTGTVGKYTFKPTGVNKVYVSSPSFSGSDVTYSAFSEMKANNDGSYTIELNEGRNIVKLESAKGVEYQVVRARNVDYSLVNATSEGQAPVAGETVNVLFGTVFHPCNKLSGIYNMGATLTLKGDNGTTFSGKANQYQFAATETAQTVAVKMPAQEAGYSGNSFYKLNGNIKCSGYGNPYGDHRNLTYEVGANPNFTASMRTAYFAQLPSVTIEYAHQDSIQVPADVKVLDLSAPLDDYGFDGNGIWEGTYDDELSVVSYDGFYLTHYSVSSWNYWTGWVPSINGDSTNYARKGSSSNWISRQWGAMTRGGVAMSEDGAYIYTLQGTSIPVSQYGAPYLTAYCWASDKNDAEGTTMVYFDNTSEVLGAYVALAPWTYYGVVSGDGFATPFSKDGDTLSIIAYGYDDEGNKISSAVMRMAEYSDGVLSVTKNWEWFDLSPLGKVASVNFVVWGSDAGQYGLNTAAYFNMDKMMIRPVSVSISEENADAASDGKLKVRHVGNSLIGVPDNSEVYLYSISGRMLASMKNVSGEVRLPVREANMIIKIISDSNVQTLR